MNTNSFRISLISCAALLLLSGFAASALADPGTSQANAPVGGTAGNDPTISFHGFIDSSFFWQDQNFSFGNGQNAEIPLPNTGSKDNLSGGDVRNTRFWIDFAGPTLSNGWTAGGHIEADFFGGFNGTTAFSGQQPNPRLRQAFISLKNATGGTLTIGQQWDLLFPIDNFTESFTHIAFPLGLGDGMIGWRYPGVTWFQNLGQPAPGTPQWRLDLGVFEGNWSGPGSTINFQTAGNVNFQPQIEARLHVQDKDWLAYIVGHYSREDLSGVGGNAPTPIASSITSYAIEAGLGLHPGPWVLHAGVYTGKGLGQVFGALVQFGDIKEVGGYAQGGYKFNPNWGLYATYATDRPNAGDVITWLKNGSSGLLRGQQMALDLLYTNGPYGLGFEYLHAITRSTTTGLDRTTTVGNQLSVSAIYHF